MLAVVNFLCEGDGFFWYQGTRQVLKLQKDSKMIEKPCLEK